MENINLEDKRLTGWIDQFKGAYDALLFIAIVALMVITGGNGQLIEFSITVILLLLLFRKQPVE